MMIKGNDAIRVLSLKLPSERFWAAARRILGHPVAPPRDVPADAMRIKNPTVLASVQKRYREWSPQDTCQDCWLRITKEVFREYGRRCLVCGSGDHVSAHHVIPRGETCSSCGCGGPHTLGNLIPLCDPCHDFVESHESKPRTPQGCVAVGLIRFH